MLSSNSKISEENDERKSLGEECGPSCSNILLSDLLKRQIHKDFEIKGYI